MYVPDQIYCFLFQNQLSFTSSIVIIIRYDPPDTEKPQEIDRVTLQQLLNRRNEGRKLIQSHSIPS